MYEFKNSDAFDFARHTGIKTYHKGNELHFRVCPYCNGGNGRDKNTFSINLNTGVHKCLRASCNASGNMVTLAKDFDFSLGYADEYYKPRKTYKKLKTPDKPIIPKPEAIQYLLQRGITEEVANQYEITTQKDNPKILVFPFFDDKGKMQFVKYRKTDFDKSKDKNKEWCEADCKPILFGMKQCNYCIDRVVITEGQIDSLSVATAGIYNAVSVPTGAKGFTWLPYCWDWLNGFSEIVIFGDYEKGSMSLLDELSNRLKSKIKHVRYEDYKDCKDANEILKKYGPEQVRACVDNAVSMPIKQIVDLADVKDVDVFKIPKLKTGINQIDRLLYGGLPLGGVVLISGKPGEGKSTLASQILINAIEQGYKCFAYSGELPNYLFKAWLDFQCAGPSHVYAYKNSWGDENYNISNMNRENITAWYRGKCFLYDNTHIDGNEKESLVKVTENIIMQHGVKVILLDNLMTAIDLEENAGSDKYEKQSLFVKKLARVALKHNALILLVAHKRKNNFSTNENDEISGSGDISNLATITIAYEKDNDIEPMQRLCKVSKNRLFGKTETKGYVLNYDERSKRVYGDGDNLYREYGWSKSAKGDFLDADEETPFD